MILLCQQGQQLTHVEDERRLKLFLSQHIARRVESAAVQKISNGIKLMFMI